MAKILLLLELASLCLIASSKIYSTTVKCGPCNTKTGCTGSKCLNMTGDVTGEFCYGRNTCDFTEEETVQFGTCTQDFSGSSCSSGMCMLAKETCFSSLQGQCQDGTIFNQTCASGTVSSFVNGLKVNQPVNLGIDCPFTQINASYRSCTKDNYGSFCSCCASISINGTNSMIGTCVPTGSPLLAAKATLGASILALLSSVLLFLLAFHY